jgi:nicotinate phosphoribosyltransferase
MAGCIGTSNAMAADMLNIKAMGTQAHSWIESYDSEYEAFLAYAKAYPNNCLLLVDTIDTLRSGVPNAIKVAKEYLIPNGYRLKGIRIDSGDLAYLSKEARKMLDDARLTDAGICLSNGLNAKTIESLVAQGASFTSLGVGDNISKPDGRMGCVYKEVALKQNNTFIPKIKLSNDFLKIINPGYKKLYRAYDKETGYAIADVMAMHNEKIKEEDLIIVNPTNYLARKTINNFDLIELQKPVFANGTLVYDDPDIRDKQKYCNEQMATIYPEVRRNEMPQEYYVDGTENYVNFKNEIIDETKRLIMKK